MNWRPSPGIGIRGMYRSTYGTLDEGEVESLLVGLRRLWPTAAQTIKTVCQTIDYFESDRNACATHSFALGGFRAQVNQRSRQLKESVYRGKRVVRKRGIRPMVLAGLGLSILLISAARRREFGA